MPKKSDLLSKDICIVGNATSLLKKNYGKMVDQHKSVIRLNKGFPKKKQSQGKRTTLVGTSCPISWIKFRWHYGKSSIMWMSPFQKDFPKWITKQENFNRYPKERWNKLNQFLDGKRPSTGAMMIDYVCNVINPERLRIYGFDFKASDTLFRKKQNLGPHDWIAEQKYVTTIITQAKQSGKDWEIVS